MSQSAPSMPAATSRLLALPLELKYEILSHLEGPEPAQIILRRTHSSFHDIIPNSAVHKKLSPAERRAHLIAADRLASSPNSEQLFFPKHLACMYCLRVLTSNNFSEGMSHGSRRLGGDRAAGRACMKCRLAKGRADGEMLGGRFMTIGGAEHCIFECGLVTAREDGNGLSCEECNEDFDAVSGESRFVPAPVGVYYHLACVRKEEGTNEEWTIANCVHFS